MAREFTLSIVAPDRNVVEEPVTSVIAPGIEGYFGVQAGHVPYVAALRPGLVEYQDANLQRRFVNVGGGFAEVVGDRMTILADEAQHVDEIDVERAQEALDEARRALTGSGDSGQTTEEAVLEMERAISRLRAAQRFKS